MPAVGFALYLDAVAWAREAAGVREPENVRVVVALGDASAAVAHELRLRGICAVDHADESAASFAESWHFSHLAHGGAQPSLVALGNRAAAAGPNVAAVPLPATSDPAAIAAAIESEIP